MKIFICILLLIGIIFSIYDATVLGSREDDIDIYEIRDDK